MWRIWILLFISLPTSLLAQTTGPAPSGEPAEVARLAIAKAEHPCSKVKKASRNSDGSISAMCTNREDYRIFSVNGSAIAMRCSAARKLGVQGC